MSLANQAGHEITAPISENGDTASTDVNFDGWAADSNYFALVIPTTPNDVNPKTRENLVVWSVPDLKIVNESTLTDVLDSACILPYGGDLPFCANWASVGSELAYARVVDNSQQVVVHDFKHGISKTFTISGDPTDFLWSPDGQHVAVRMEGSKPYGEVFGLDGKHYPSVGGTINRSSGGEGWLPADMVWSGDGSVLYYVVKSVSDRGDAFSLNDFYTVKAFYLASDEWKTLLSRVMEPLHTNFSTTTFIDPHPAYSFTNDFSYLIGKISFDTDPLDNPVAGIEAVVVDTKTLRQTVLLHVIAPMEVFWLADNRTAVAVTQTQLSWVNVNTGKIHSFQYPDPGTISHLEITPDSRQIMLTIADKSFLVDANTGTLLSK